MNSQTVKCAPWPGDYIPARAPRGQGVSFTARLGLSQHHLLVKLGSWGAEPRSSPAERLPQPHSSHQAASMSEVTTSGHLGGLLETLGSRLPACQNSYPGEVSRVTEARALLKRRVSQSLASRSRICGGSQSKAQTEPSARGCSLARPLPQSTRESWQGGTVWVSYPALPL